MSTPLFNAFICNSILEPPKTANISNLLDLFKLSNSSLTCKASSLVGVKIIAFTVLPDTSTFDKILLANASVFPVPVCD